MTMLPDWFNNIVGPILLIVMIGCMAATCVALCLWIWHENKEDKKK